MKDISLTRAETQRQRGNEILDTHKIKQLTVGVVIGQRPFNLDAMEGNPIITTGSFGRIHAASEGEPVLNMKAAVLQVPTSGASGFGGFDVPQTNQAFLHQILLEHAVSSEAGNDLSQ